MRTNEERIASMHARAGELEKERRNREIKIVQTAGVISCMVLVLLFSLQMPGITAGIAPETCADMMSASIFSGSVYLGYIVIGITAFLLGAAVTVFCFKLKKWQEDNKKND